MKYAVLLVLVLAGCPSDDPPPVDAPAVIDGPAGTVCTGQLYDRCTSNAQCMSGNCRMFNNLGIMMCTQTCTAGGAACPTQNGAAVECVTNSMICRPASANTCTPP
jgi:hypothetical protein